MIFFFFSDNLLGEWCFSHSERMSLKMSAFSCPRHSWRIKDVQTHDDCHWVLCKRHWAFRKVTQAIFSIMLSSVQWKRYQREGPWAAWANWTKTRETEQNKTRPDMTEVSEAWNKQEDRNHRWEQLTNSLNDFQINRQSFNNRLIEVLTCIFYISLIYDKEEVSIH